MDLFDTFNLLVIGQLVIESVDVFVDETDNAVGLRGWKGTMEGEDFVGHV